MTVTHSLRIPKYINARSKLRKTTLVLAMLASGAVAFAEPAVYSDSFTLSTSNQSMWGSGTQSSFSYDSGVVGAKWGSYRSTPFTPRGDDVVSIGGIAGDANTTIIPKICFPTIFGGDQCT